jgi:cellulose synthase/poly-beta-1,6-N-acetylglucosamine synthase-like glycosyltransferase
LLPIRLLAIRHYLRSAAPGPSPAPDPAALAAADLPRYSILVALYDEAVVVPQLVANLKALDYPADGLNVLLLIEADDAATAAALAALNLPAHMTIVTVPPGLPRTKPRALVHGLALTTGDYVVVYDAEDRPEPDQLRLAVAAFAAGGERLGCLQARLNIDNRDDGLIARQFTIEYTALFDAIVPALAAAGAPVPLGGTSNHFRRAALDDTGGWDPWNVTEDADLGFRLARMGWRVEALNSTTWEEAPVGLSAWLAQRTRWQKGWMQTWLVHMRTPSALWRELGPWRFVWLQLVLGGGLLAALAHPWLYVGLVWRATATDRVAPSTSAHALADAATPPAMAGGMSVAEIVTVIAVLTLVVSVISSVVLARLTLQRRGFTALRSHALLMPVTWLFISVAAYRALFELWRRPFHWAKTRHGLTSRREPDRRS